MNLIVYISSRAHCNPNGTNILVDCERHCKLLSRLMELNIVSPLFVFFIYFAFQVVQKNMNYQNSVINEKMELNECQHKIKRGIYNC
jgi:hypothetical protein